PPSSTNNRYLSSSRIGEYFSRSVVPAGAAATAVAGTAAAAVAGTAAAAVPGTAATTAVAATVSGWGADHGSDRDAVGHGRAGLGVGGEDHPEATGVVDGLIHPGQVDQHPGLALEGAEGLHRLLEALAHQIGQVADRRFTGRDGQIHSRSHVHF